MLQPKSPKPESAQLRVRVVPRSSQNKIVVVDGGLKVWVTAAPVDGGANIAVCALIAKSLSIAPSRVAVLKGETSREKFIAIEGIDVQQVLEILSNLK